MTRYPKASPFVPIHNCYDERLKYNLEKDRWECPVCGIQYSPPGLHFAPKPEPKLAFFQPWKLPIPDLAGRAGHCNGDGSLLLEPGKKVHLRDIKASVFVTWLPWLDYAAGMVQ